MDCLFSNSARAIDFKGGVQRGVEPYGVMARQDRIKLLDDFSSLGPATQGDALKQLDQLKKELGSAHKHGAVTEVSRFQEELKTLRDQGPSAASCFRDKIKDTLRADQIPNPLPAVLKDVQETQARIMECRIDRDSCERSKP